jgi:hypothetical protein
MDKPEDTKEPTLPPETSAAGAIADPRIEIVKVEAPSIVPSVDVASDGKPSEAPKSGGASESIAPAAPRPTVAAVPELAASSAALPLRRALRTRRLFTPLAAAVVLASAMGAMAGALAATGIARLASVSPDEPPVAAAPDPAALSAAIAQLRSEIGTLRSSLEAGNRSAATQFAKLSDRFERIERAQAAGKPDMSAAKETTGAIAPASAATPAPLPPGAMPGGQASPGWVVRDVYRGAAILQSKNGAMIEVGPGDVLPGVGRIEAVRRQDGHWIVVTSKGIITSMR